MKLLKMMRDVVVYAFDKALDGFLLAVGALLALFWLMPEARATELVTVTASSQDGGAGWIILLALVVVIAAGVWLKVKKPTTYASLSASGDRAWQWIKAAVASRFKK